MTFTQRGGQTSRCLSPTSQILGDEREVAAVLFLLLGRGLLEAAGHLATGQAAQAQQLLEEKEAAVVKRVLQATA